MSAARHSAPAALRLLHYWWPVVMAWSFAVVVGRATGHRVSSAGLDMLLLGTLAAYSCDRLLDGDRASQPPWLRAALGIALLGSAVAALPLLPLLSRAKVVFLVVLALVALAYPWIKRIAWVKAILVPAVWTSAAIALPAGWPWLLSPVALPLFLLIASGCLLCDVKDADADARNGVESVPVRLGVGPSLGLAAAVALIAAGFAGWEHRSGLLLCGLALAALAPWRALLSAEAIGPLAVDLLLTMPGLLIAAHLI